MCNLIVSSKPWHKKFVEDIERYTNAKVIYIEEKEELNFAVLETLKPNYIFFPHWSYIIPPEIYERFECVIFHMTDVPFGRGGSPLQNLIVREIYETKLTALRCGKELDAGPVYMKKTLSLYGSAEEIYLRAAQLTRDMMIEIIRNNVKPTEQIGKATVFKRRKPSESNIKDLWALEKVFDYIRMLDAEDYPQAFIETEYLRFEFERAILKDGYIKADVKITARNGNSE